MLRFFKLIYIVILRVSFNSKETESEMRIFRILTTFVASSLLALGVAPVNASTLDDTFDLDVAFKGFPLGWDAWMQANVSGNTAWTTNN